MKKTLLFSLALLVSAYTGSAIQADIIFEDFDYTAGDSIVGQSGGTGLTGNYTGAGNSGNFDAVSGLSFGNLEVSGGASGRTDRSGNGAISRAISTAAQAEIAAQNQVWFSVLMNPTVTGDELSGGLGMGFATNTYGTLLFGDSNFTNGSGGGFGTYGGSGFGVGFADTSDNSGNFDNIQIRAAAFDGGTGDNSAARVVTGNVTSFIVGQFDFTTNQLNVWNVTDPNLALPAAVTSTSTITGGLSSTDITTISITDAQTSIFDEIRLGSTLASVTPTAVPEPSSLFLLGVAGLGLISRRRR